MWTIIGWIVCVLAVIGGVSIFFEGDLIDGLIAIVFGLGLWYFFLRSPSAPDNLPP